MLKIVLAAAISDDPVFIFSTFPVEHLSRKVVGITIGEHVVVKVVCQLLSKMKCCSF
jgi:hypothetical protein